MQLGEALAKAAIGGLVMTVLTGAAMVLAFGDKVSRPELVEYVDHELSPIDDALDEVVSLQRQQLVEQATLSAQLAALLERLKD